MFSGLGVGMSAVLTIAAQIGFRPLVSVELRQNSQSGETEARRGGQMVKNSPRTQQ
jgi:hypothetical protein